MSNSTIEDVKSRLNLTDVISSYVSLKKAGVNYKANCPFHHEKTASFMVSPSKQIWHCFGCGEGGDVFGFVMKYENIDFSQALKILAEKAGVQLPKFTKAAFKQEDRRQLLVQINELAAKFYHKILQDSSVAAPARKYLKDRSLSAEAIRNWQLGFAPADAHVLEKFLIKKGYKVDQLVDAGVISKSFKNTRSAQFYDRFFNRITFPIKNYVGETVGFTARVTDPMTKAAKYINSPETMIYSKSNVIFGLYQAKQEIRKQDCAVVVEGNMDVITPHEAGFKNVVASSGTAFTYEQLQLLSRLTKNLKFAFDADAAGLMATRRTLETALQLGFNVYIIEISGAKDPDELVRNNPKAFAKAISEAPLYIDYFFARSFASFDPNSIQDKKRIVTELLPLIQKLIDPLDIAHYIKLLAQRLSVAEKVIYEIYAQNKPEAMTQHQHEKKPAYKPLLKKRSYYLEEKLLGYALFKESYRKIMADKTAVSEFQDPKIQRILSALQAYNKPNIEGFLTDLGELADVAKKALFMVEFEYDQSAADKNIFEKQFSQILREFKANNIKVEMNALAGQMVLAEQKQDKAMLLDLHQKFLELSQALKEHTYEK